MGEQHEGNQITNVIGDDHHDIRGAYHHNECAGFNTHRDDPRIRRRMRSTKRPADKPLVVKQTEEY